VSSKKSKLLVTGGAGYIGSVVSARLIERGHQVVVLDDLSTGFRSSIPQQAGFIRASLHDAHRFVDSTYDAVLHFAACAEVAESVVRPEKYWYNNVLGSFALLEAIRAASVGRLVFSSSCAVYGEPKSLPITEDAPTAPMNPYGASKLAVDQMISGYCSAHGLAAVSLRYFNVAGALGAFGERHSPESHLIPRVLLAAQQHGGPIQVNGDDFPTADGTCVRDYVHVADLAEAHLLALGAAVPSRHLIYNLGNGQGYSVRQVIRAAREVTGSELPEKVGPRRVGDPAILVASATRAAAELGWKPRRPTLHDMVSDAWAFAVSACDDR
jgi:UDP-glucose 4-epimerase